LRRYNEVMVNKSGVISYSVDGYLVSQDLPGDLSDSATVSAWLAHPGRAVHADGETLFACIPKVGRCRLTVSNPVLKAPTVSALETGISNCFRGLLSISTCAAPPRA
jgi:hypothetical protein